MWFKEDKEFKDLEDFPEDVVGFVYEVKHLETGKRYIGKKILKHKRTLKPLKGYKRKRVKYVESDWKTYTGSNDTTKRWLWSECDREILELCKNKTMMSYYETKYQFKRDAIENNNYLNDNILGRYYRKSLKKYMK